MNRDWHNTPLQGGGRDGYGYGLTTLERPARRWSMVEIIGCIVMGLIFGFAIGGWIAS